MNVYRVGTALWVAPSHAAVVDELKRLGLLDHILASKEQFIVLEFGPVVKALA